MTDASNASAWAADSPSSRNPGNPANSSSSLGGTLREHEDHGIRLQVPRHEREHLRG